MEGVARKLSPAAFVLTLVCFFLPFVTFSCQGQKIASFSGIQLATGTTIEQPQMFGPPKSQKVDAEPLAILALLSVLAGAGLSFLKRKKGAVNSAALAGLGIILLGALKSKVDGDALRQGAGAIQINYEAGFYLAIVFLLAAIGASVYALLAGKGIRLPVLQGGGGTRFCTQCGARNASGDLFCKECGAKFT
jgi:hypothetical protein